jgi:transposase InsO family protein
MICTAGQRARRSAATWARRLPTAWASPTSRRTACSSLRAVPELSRHGLITPEPHKRPRSSFIRFEAALPNELWQTDATHWSLEGGRAVEILNMIDDHSRLVVAAVAFATVKAADVVAVFYDAAQRHGYPAALLSDNAAVFSGGSRKGKVLLETELERLGIGAKHSTPYHPQTCDKVERFHQTQKRYLARQAPAASLAHLQLQLDTFAAYYNQHRPHRALDGRSPTPRRPGSAISVTS